jgi:hypothetical protein
MGHCYLLLNLRLRLLLLLQLLNTQSLLLLLPCLLGLISCCLLNQNTVHCVITSSGSSSTRLALQRLGELQLAHSVHYLVQWGLLVLQLLLLVC